MDRLTAQRQKLFNKMSTPSNEETSDQLSKNVWIFAKPLSGASVIPTFITALISRGKFPLCHWGVLITHLTSVDVERLEFRTGELGQGDDSFGVLWELNRAPDDKNTVNVQPFTLLTLKNQWIKFSAKYIGTTTMNHDEIQREGINSSSFVCCTNLCSLPYY